MSIAVARTQREHPRQEVSIDVVIAVGNDRPFTLKTGNLSESGVFLRAERGQRLPSEGTEFIATLNEFLGSTEPMALRGRVIHRQADGIGVEFIGPV
jgi:hypothetical protein